MAGRLKEGLIFLLVIALIGLGVNYIAGYPTTTLISQQTINGRIYYFYDFAGYFKNIVQVLNKTPTLIIELPTREWQTGEWGALLNDLAFILDYLILLINVTIYPVRVGGYIVSVLWGVLGFNMDPTINTGMFWIIKMSLFFRDLTIPYV